MSGGKRGRPRFAPGEARTVVLQVRMTETEFENASAAAARDGALSISDWARSALAAAAEDDGTTRSS